MEGFSAGDHTFISCDLHGVLYCGWPLGNAPHALAARFLYCWQAPWATCRWPWRSFPAPSVALALLAVPDWFMRKASARFGMIIFVYHRVIALGFFLVAKRIRMVAELRDAMSLPDIVAARYRSEAVRFLIALTIVLGVYGLPCDPNSGDGSGDEVFTGCNGFFCGY